MSHLKLNKKDLSMRYYQSVRALGIKIFFKALFDFKQLFGVIKNKLEELGVPLARNLNKIQE
jgi:hypothetical protein